MEINPRALYTIAEVAEITKLSVSQIHQAKYKKQIIVHRIEREFEQVLGNEIIKFMKTQYYKDRIKKIEDESNNLVCEEPEIMDEPQQLIISNSNMIESSTSSMLRELFSSIGNREVNIHLHIHNYYGKGE